MKKVEAPNLGLFRFKNLGLNYIHIAFLFFSQYVLRLQPSLQTGATVESRMKFLNFLKLISCKFKLGHYRRFDRLDALTKLRAIELVEYLRLDGAIYKPYLTGEARWNEQGKLVLVPETINKAADLYRDWWHSSISWQEKKKISPLDGSGLSIIGIP